MKNYETQRLQARFLNTLLPAAGGASAFTAFFPAALTPPRFCAAVGALFPPRFTTVVAFDVVDISLPLLTILVSVTGGAAAALLALVIVVGFVAFRPPPRATLPRGFGPFSLAKVAVAATATDFAGESCLEGESGLRGEVGRPRSGFCGEGRLMGRIGDWGRVREFEDLGERIVDGLVTWRLGPLVVVVLVRFFGLGIWPGSGVFSLSALSSLSLGES